MDEVFKRSILELLKTAGFESIEARALEALMAVYTDRITAYLHTISKLSELASRPCTSLLDLFEAKQKLPRIGKNLLFTEEMHEECHVAIPNCKNKTVQSLFMLILCERKEFPREILEEEKEWASPLSTRVEKLIHIYEFMPNFPPIHTFRVTQMKSSAFKNQSAKVKSRLEQSLRSEGNMVKLIKSSGSMPKFINYVYKGKI